ncbi:HlyD family efflux transporter periplasmic adaptor subunit [soil metagenome]
MNIMHSLKNKIVSWKNWFQKASWKKKIALIVAVIIVIYIATSPLRSKGTVYTTEPVSKNTVIDTVSESGNIASSGRFDVYSTSTGYIEEVYVQNGIMVERGDDLFKVKSTSTPQEQASAYTSYQNAASAQKTSEQNKLTYQALLGKDRQTVIDAQNAVDFKNNNTVNPATKKEYTDLEKQSIDASIENARQTFTADEKKYLDVDTSINAAKAAVNSTWLAYQATKDVVVGAPAPGVIANFSYSIGDKVVANASSALSSASSATPALVILGDLSKVSVKIPLNEVDVNKVKIGQAATITFDAFRDRKYKGHVSTIDTAGTNTNGVITYNASVVIDNPDTNIKTEMTATVAIETARHANVLTVTNSAVKPYKGGKAVLVKGEDKANLVKNKAGKQLPLHYVPVKIGLKGVTRTEITSGVTEGMEVVTSSIN